MFKAGIGRAVFREEVDLASVVAFIDGFDSAGPGGAVTVVDLAEIEQGFLNGSTTCHAATFHDTPVAVLLAVLEPFVRSQKHDLGWSILPGSRGVYGLGLHHRHFRKVTLVKSRVPAPQRG